MAAGVVGADGWAGGMEHMYVPVALGPTGYPALVGPDVLPWPSLSVRAGMAW